jgi:hypothetical protein
MVSEGMTEVGILNGAREFWPPLHGGMPIEQVGGFIADGNGAEAPAIALGLRGLGFQVALYRDSDTALPAGIPEQLAEAGVPVIEYGNGLDVEHAIISQADEVQMQRLLDHLRAERGEGKINDNLRAALGMGLDEITSPFAMWDLIAAHDAAGIRAIVADVCVQRKWLKDQRIARGAGPIAWDVAQSQPGSPLALSFAATRAWLYA